MTRINQFFAFMARQHYYTNTAIGAVLAIFFSLFVEFDAEMLRLMIDPFLLFFLVMSMGGIHAKRLFYEGFQIDPEELKMFGYVVIRDLFFEKMIKSPIGLLRKKYGYFYLICRFFHHAALGFLVMILVIIFTALLGG
jgi:hypothetical protein